MIAAPQKAKIKWQCRRGMLELDLILNKFLEQHLDSLSLEQSALLEKLLNAPDPVLYSWLVDDYLPEDKELLPLVNLVKRYNLP